MKKAVVVWIVAAAWVAGASGQQATWRFDFGPGPAADGTMRVPPEAVYSDALGFGFEPGAKIEGIDRGGDPLTGDFCTSAELFHFSVAVPEEGNYRVTVTPVTATWRSPSDARISR